MSCIKIIAKFLNWRFVYFARPLKYIVKKAVPAKQAAISNEAQIMQCIVT